MRRAMRVRDNIALYAAIQDANEVVPVLCLNTEKRYEFDTPRRRYVRSAIASLDSELRSRGSQLFVLSGDIVDELPRFAKEVGAEVVFGVDVYDPVSLNRDQQLRRGLFRAGVELLLLKDRVIFEKQEILNQSRQPFKVFTPYKKAWLEFSDSIPPLLPDIRSVSSPADADGRFSLSRQKSFANADRDTEAVGLRQLKQFVKRKVLSYKEQRDFPALEATSKLSAALSLGVISIRQVYWAAIEQKRNADKRGRENIDTFISELIWREFYYQILANYPHAAERSFRDEFNKLDWSENKKYFTAWCEGRTGYPIVDAGMRQLVQEGWMHNRVRMIVASFLTKDLHISWQWGEKFFLEHLCDADIASNNGGWQWAAGTGTDASPWFRIFNPVSQGKRFDPNGDYVWKYVPELKNVPPEFIHSPWMMDAKSARGIGFGKEYPAPIIDHAVEREVTIEMYKNAASRK